MAHSQEGKSVSVSVLPIIVVRFPCLSPAMCLVRRRAKDPRDSDFLFLLPLALWLFFGSMVRCSTK
jgi:hypothetical protein